MKGKVHSLLRSPSERRAPVPPPRPEGSRRDAKGHSLVLKSCPASISFQLSQQHLLLSGAGETGLGNRLWCHPSPSLHQGSSRCPADSLSFSAGTGGKPGTREGSRGRGWGMAPGGRPWQSWGGGSFSQAPPASPFLSSLPAQNPEVLRPSHSRSAHSGEKGFDKLTSAKVLRTECASAKTRSAL